MPRLVTNRKLTSQQNPWGIQGGEDAQRSDLWQVIFNDAVLAIKQQASPVSVYANLSGIFPYECQSLTLPDLRIKSEPVRRDSRNYQMPAADEPLDAIKMTFLVNADPEANSNLILVLEAWRALTRAGRGSISTEGSFTLNANYSIDYAFDVYVNLLRGGYVNAGFSTQRPVPSAQPSNAGAPGLVFADAQAQNTSSSTTVPVSVSKDDFGTGYAFRLKNCWLAGYRVTELSHTDSKLLTVDAMFYADDVREIGATGRAYVTPRAPIGPFR